MHDAVVLANYINTLPLHSNAEEITQAFKNYQDERMPWVVAASGSSKIFRTMTSRTVAGAMVRSVAKNMPAWVQRKNQIRLCVNRPQIAFLPKVEDTGSVKPAAQPSLKCKAPSQDDQSTTSAV
ncbi:hypothetical protein BGX29_011473 [Mortierella sp. GBA35]|nr:hypothetical protein BGX29_011473 [Mortierella sp. GBA35]